MGLTDGAVERFDMRKVRDHFQHAVRSEDDVDVREYVMAYTNLNMLFPLLGRLFNFIASDIAEKCGILEQHLASSECAHFETVATMIAYEQKEGVFEKDVYGNGSRNLLRLHRALGFLLEFIEAIANAHDEDKTSPLASTAYDKTIAQFHPWLIKQSVHLALKTLPRRGALIETLRNDIEKEEAPTILADLVKAGTEVHQRIQREFVAKNLLNLP